MRSLFLTSALGALGKQTPYPTAPMQTPQQQPMPMPMSNPGPPGGGNVIGSPVGGPPPQVMMQQQQQMPMQMQMPQQPMQPMQQQQPHMTVGPAPVMAPSGPMPMMMQAEGEYEQGQEGPNTNLARGGYRGKGHGKGGMMRQPGGGGGKGTGKSEDPYYMNKYNQNKAEAPPVGTPYEGIEDAKAYDGMPTKLPSELQFQPAPNQGLQQIYLYHPLTSTAVEPNALCSNENDPVCARASWMPNEMGITHPNSCKAAEMGHRPVKAYSALKELRADAVKADSSAEGPGSFVSALAADRASAAALAAAAQSLADTEKEDPNGNLKFSGSYVPGPCPVPLVTDEQGYVVHPNDPRYAKSDIVRCSLYQPVCVHDLVYGPDPFKVHSVTFPNRCWLEKYMGPEALVKMKEGRPNKKYDDRLPQSINGQAITNGKCSPLCKDACGFFQPVCVGTTSYPNVCAARGMHGFLIKDNSDWTNGQNFNKGMADLRNNVQSGTFADGSLNIRPGLCVGHDARPVLPAHNSPNEGWILRNPAPTGYRWINRPFLVPHIVNKVEETSKATKNGGLGHFTARQCGKIDLVCIRTREGDFRTYLNKCLAFLDGYDVSSGNPTQQSDTEDGGEDRLTVLSRSGIAVNIANNDIAKLKNGTEEVGACMTTENSHYMTLTDQSHPEKGDGMDEAACNLLAPVCHVDYMVTFLNPCFALRAGSDPSRLRKGSCSVGTGGQPLCYRLKPVCHNGVTYVNLCMLIRHFAMSSSGTPDNYHDGACRVKKFARKALQENPGYDSLSCSSLPAYEHFLDPVCFQKDSNSKLVTHLNPCQVALAISNAASADTGMKNWGKCAIPNSSQLEGANTGGSGAAASAGGGASSSTLMENNRMITNSLDAPLGGTTDESSKKVSMSLAQGGMELERRNLLLQQSEGFGGAKVAGSYLSLLQAETAIAAYNPSDIYNEQVPLAHHYEQNIGDFMDHDDASVSWESPKTDLDDEEDEEMLTSGGSGETLLSSSGAKKVSITPVYHNQADKASEGDKIHYSVRKHIAGKGRVHVPLSLLEQGVTSLPPDFTLYDYPFKAFPEDEVDFHASLLQLFKKRHNIQSHDEAKAKIEARLGELYEHVTKGRVSGQTHFADLRAELAQERQERQKKIQELKEQEQREMMSLKGYKTPPIIVNNKEKNSNNMKASFLQQGEHQPFMSRAKSSEELLEMEATAREALRDDEQAGGPGGPLGAKIGAGGTALSQSFRRDMSDEAAIGEMGNTDSSSVLRSWLRRRQQAMDGGFVGGIKAHSMMSLSRFDQEHDLFTGFLPGETSCEELEPVCFVKFNSIMVTFLSWCAAGKMGVAAQSQSSTLYKACPLRGMELYKNQCPPSDTQKVCTKFGGKYRNRCEAWNAGAVDFQLRNAELWKKRTLHDSPTTTVMEYCKDCTASDEAAPIVSHERICDLAAGWMTHNSMCKYLVTPSANHLHESAILSGTCQNIAGRIEVDIKTWFPSCSTNIEAFSRFQPIFDKAMKATLTATRAVFQDEKVKHLNTFQWAFGAGCAECSNQVTGGCLWKRMENEGVITENEDLLAEQQAKMGLSNFNKKSYNRFSSSFFLQKSAKSMVGMGSSRRSMTIYLGWRCDKYDGDEGDACLKYQETYTMDPVGKKFWKDKFAAILRQELDTLHTQSQAAQAAFEKGLKDWSDANHAEEGGYKHIRGGAEKFYAYPQTEIVRLEWATPISNIEEWELDENNKIKNVYGEWETSGGSSNKTLIVIKDDQHHEKQAYIDFGNPYAEAADSNEATTTVAATATTTAAPAAANGITTAASATTTTASATTTAAPATTTTASATTTAAPATTTAAPATTTAAPAAAAAAASANDSS